MTCLRLVSALALYHILIVYGTDGVAASSLVHQRPLVDTLRDATGITKVKVNTLWLRGTVRSGFDPVTAKPNLDRRSLEFRIHCPSSFVRIERVRDTMRFIGFVGPNPLYEVRALTADTQVSQDPPPASLAQRQRVLLARYLLAMLADTCGVIPTTAQASGDTQVTVQGPSGFVVQLSSDPSTRLPAALLYKETLPFPEALTPEEKKAGRMQKGTTELADVAIVPDAWKQVEGLHLPHRLRKESKGLTFEEIIWDRAEVNVALPADSFRR